MISVYDLKPRFQSLLRPLVKALYKTGVTANQVTVFALLLSIAYGSLLLTTGNPGWLWGMPLLLFIRMALNAVDGMLAREFDQKSDLGCFLNELSDVIADAFLYITFICFLPSATWLVWVFVILAILTEFTGVVAVMIGQPRRYDGPMGKSDRAFVLSLISILVALQLLSQTILFIVFVVLSLLASYTVYRRILNALKPSTSAKT